MQFIFKKQILKPVFGEVKVNQFFVNLLGDLCQKHHEDSYNIVADSDGHLKSERINGVSHNNTIKHIIPEVEKIEF